MNPRLLIPLALLALTTAGPAAEDPAPIAGLPPAPQALRMRWRVMRDLGRLSDVQIPPDPAAIQEAIALSADSGALLDEHPECRQWFWGDIDRMLRRARAEDLVPLRALQESKAAMLAQEVIRSGDAADGLRLFRRYPWARSTHEVLIRLGENALQAGNPGTALRLFEDVIAHAEDDELRAQARIGTWLALAAQPDCGPELEQALAAAPDETLLPWRGAPLRAAGIKAAIRRPAPVHPGPLAQLRRVKVQLPAAIADVEPALPADPLSPLGLGPWTLRRIETAADLLVVIGSRHVACYDASTLTLRRLYDDPLLAAAGAADEEHPAVLGRSGSSAIGHGGREQPGRMVLYRRIAVGTGESPSVEVAAWNLAGGALLWRTGDGGDWRQLAPRSEPVASEGCVYVVAAGRKPTTSVSFFLVCLDGDSGGTLWRRGLGTRPLDARLGHSLQDGGSLCVEQGAVYVSTDAGLAARCDARDGALEWICSYSQREGDEPARREGAPPVVADGKVLLAPRDCEGVLALDALTGRALWRNADAAAESLVGTSAGVLVAQQEAGLLALNLQTGTQAWRRDLNAAEAPRAVVAGAEVLAVEGRRLMRLGAGNGAVAEELRLEGQPGAELVPLANGVLAEFAAQPVADPAELPGSVAGALRLPLALHWSLPCARPLLIHDPAGAQTNEFAVLAGRLLFGVEAQPRGRILWQSRLRSRPQSVGYHGKRLVASRDRTVTALDAGRGTTDWVVRLPFRADAVVGDERMLFAAELTRAGAAAALDPATGAVLWQQEYGKDPRMAEGRLEWAALQRDPAGGAALHLYWNAADCGGNGRRPAVVIADAASGAIREVKRFLPAEPQWPPQISFSDARTYTRLRRLPPWPDRGPFAANAVAYVGDGGRAHFAELGSGRDLAPELALVLEVRPEAQFWSSAGLHPAIGGVYLRRLGKLMWISANGATGTVYELPRGAGRSGFNMIDFRPGTGTVAVVSGPEAAFPEPAIGRSRVRGAAPAVPPALPDAALSLDLFERQTGRLLGTQQLPGPKKQSAGYASHALLLENGLVVTDAEGVYFLRPAR